MARKLEGKVPVPRAASASPPQAFRAEGAHVFVTGRRRVELNASRRRNRRSICTMDAMTKLVPSSTLKRVAAGEGDLFDVAGVKLRWKARGADTQFAFTINEQTLLTGESVAPHFHPYTEVFYVLDGVVTFRRIASVEGVTSQDEAIFRCAAGDTVMIPAGAVHAFSNAEQVPARILGISTYPHQLFFDGVQEANAAEPFAAMPQGEAMAKIAEIGRAHGVIFVPSQD